MWNIFFSPLKKSSKNISWFQLTLSFSENFILRNIEDELSKKKSCSKISARCRSHSYWDGSVCSDVVQWRGHPLWVIYGCFLLNPPPGNFLGKDLCPFPGFRAGWIFTAIIKSKFWACDCSYSYLVSQVKGFIENNNTLLTMTWLQFVIIEDLFIL